MFDLIELACSQAETLPMLLRIYVLCSLVSSYYSFVQFWYVEATLFAFEFCVWELPMVLQRVQLLFVIEGLRNYICVNQWTNLGNYVISERKFACIVIIADSYTFCWSRPCIICWVQPNMHRGLTHWGRMTHTRIGKLALHQSVRNIIRNHCWYIVNWNLGNKL